MSVAERVRRVVEPVVASEGVELFDLEQAGPVLRVCIDRPGGVDMTAIAAVTRALSRALDEDDPIAGSYTLEVSSPGLERALRTPRHYEWAVGKKVAVKTVPGHEGVRRVTGTVLAAGPTSFELALDEPVGARLELAYDDVEKARSVFEWGPAPKPGAGGRSDQGRRRSAAVPTTGATDAPPTDPRGTKDPST
ncbi:MAG: ribosome maturation factor RimP [Acidimicrobiales bacterium]|jgi:ribosome maturation factor RimP|nr:ribosome maturation factor RimP [Acidimicrobiales bacterium]